MESKKSILYNDLLEMMSELGKSKEAFKALSKKYKKLKEQDIRRLIKKLEKNPYTKLELYKNIKSQVDYGLNQFKHMYKKFTKKDLEHIMDTVQSRGFGYEFVGQDLSQWRKYSKVGEPVVIPFPLIRISTDNKKIKTTGTSFRRFRVVFRVLSYNHDYEITNYLSAFKNFFGDGKPFILMFKGDEGEKLTSSLYLDDPILDFKTKIANYLAQYEGATITEIHVVKQEVLGAFGAGEGEAMIKFNEEYVIHSPKSRNNCLFQALKIAATHIKKPTILTNEQEAMKSGVTLKYSVKPKSKGWSNNETIQECCDHLKRDIVLFNDNYEIEKEFNPKKYKCRVKEEPLRIMLKNNHIYAVIKKEFYKVDDKPKNKNKKEEAPDYLHEPIRKSDILNRKIMVFDLETALRDNEHIPYAVGLGWREVTKEDFEEIKEIKRRKDKISKLKSAMFKLHPNDLQRKKIYEEEIAILEDFSFIKEDEFALKTSTSETLYKGLQFWGLDCIDQMMGAIERNLEFFNGYTMYAHNGGKFDFNLLLRNFLVKKDCKFYVQSSIEQEGSFIHLVIRHVNDSKFSITLRDSIKMFSCSLAKITEDLNVKHRKAELNHGEITLDNYMSKRNEIEPYLTHDILGLLEALCIFNETVYKSIGVDMTRCMTAASLSKRNYYMNYYNKYKAPIHQLTKEQDRFIRQSYFGGRCECFHIGEIQKDIPREERKIYYYDFTSLYPSTRNELFPCGKPVYVKNWGKCDYFGFVRCRVKTKDYNKVPIHGIRHNNKLIFPYFDDWTELILFTPEMDYDQYEYDCLDGYAYNGRPFMKDVWEEGFNKKAKAKAENKPSLASLYKLIINSTYGFFGLRYESRDSCALMTDPLKLYELAKEGTLRDFTDMGGYISAHYLGDLNVKRFNVGIASAVTSYSRKRLTQLINAINATPKPEGGFYEVYYCDTDSVITNCPVERIESLRNEFIPDGTGKGLGSLKNELTDALGLEYFDAGVIAGLKQYFLGKKHNGDKLLTLKVPVLNEDGFQVRDENDKKVTKEVTKEFVIKRLKGLSAKIVNKEIGYDEYIQLTEGEKITKNVSFFSVPRLNYFDADNPHYVGMKYGTKTVRSYYDKGTHDIKKSFKVTPYYFSKL